MSAACACQSCRAACEHRPGWFAPGGAENAAALLGVTLPELFRTRLQIDYLTPSERHGVDNWTFNLVPVTIDARAGELAPALPGGRCTFLLDDGRCEIHAAKPHECATYMHDDSHEASSAMHVETGKRWATPEHQAQITALLGHVPEPPDAIEVMFAMIGLHAKGNP